MCRNEISEIRNVNLYIKPGVAIPRIGDTVWAILDKGTYCEFNILAIVNLEWTNRLLLKVTYRAEILKIQEKKHKNKGATFKIIK